MNKRKMQAKQTKKGLLIVPESCSLKMATIK